MMPRLGEEEREIPRVLVGLAERPMALLLEDDEVPARRAQQPRHLAELPMPPQAPPAAA
jgi:hypothetical protein